MKKGTRGRPTAMTPDAILKLELAFKMGATTPEACSFAEISKDTLSRYCLKYPDFREKINLWKQTPMLEAKKRVFTEIVKNRNADMAMDFLRLEEKKKTRREYAKRWREENKEKKLTAREQRKTERLRQQLLQKELDGGVNDAPDALTTSEYWKKVDEYFTNRSPVDEPESDNE